MTVLRLVAAAGVALGAGGCAALTGLDDLEGRESRPPQSEILWAKHVAAQGFQRVESMTTDAEGNLYLAGIFRGLVDFGAGPLSAPSSRWVFVAKLDAEGRPLWTQAFGTALLVHVSQVTVSEAGAVIVGGVFRDGQLEVAGATMPSQDVDGFLASFGPDGTPLWARHVGGVDDQHVSGVCTDGDLVRVAGRYDGSLSLTDEHEHEIVSGSGRGAWLGSFGPAGATHPRATLLGGVQAVGAQACRDHHIVVAGTAHGAFEVGDVTRSPLGQEDLFIVKLDYDHQHIWSAVWGDAGMNCHENCEVQLAIDRDGEVAFSGNTVGHVDFGGGALFLQPFADVFLAKLGKHGRFGAPRHLWSRALGGDVWEQRAHSMVLDHEGNILVAGLYDASFDMGGGPLPEDTDLARDVFVGSYSPSGDHRFSFGLKLESTRADPNTDEPGLPLVSATPGGDLVLALSLRGTLEAFGQRFTSQDGEDDYDLLLLKIRP